MNDMFTGFDMDRTMLRIGAMNMMTHGVENLSVLQDSPFTDQGSIVEVFTDLSVWAGIRKAIERVNANAVVA
jgi:type I restriction-modification system DNA methylase subunit